MNDDAYLIIDGRVYLKAGRKISFSLKPSSALFFAKSIVSVNGKKRIALEGPPRRFDLWPDNKHVDLEQVAFWRRCSAWTVRRHVDYGLLRPHPKGSLLFQVKEVKRWIAAIPKIDRAFRVGKVA